MSGSSSKKGGKKNSKKSGKAGSEADESSSVKNEKGKSKKKRALQAKPVTPESVHWFYYYFCCFCVLPKKFRKNKRKMELERVEQMERDARESATSEAPMDIVAKEAPSLRYKAAVKIQSLVRGCQARQAMTDYWQTAIAEASEHWLKIIRAREMAWLEKERALVARKQFVLQYVDDVFQTSLTFLSQTSRASTEIQRVWRGHKTRSLRLPQPAPPAAPVVKRRRPPKIVPKSRFSAATLRRVWSRRDFEPAHGKWLHTTDFGRLHYDLWEYADQPPRGSDQGLRINKVHAVARTEQERGALMRDKHAWVGLPIGYETLEEYRLREKEKEPENVTRLKAKSPYNAPVVDWSKFEAEYAETSRLKKEEEARMTKKEPKKRNGKGKARSSNRLSNRASSGSERSDTEQPSDFEVHAGGASVAAAAAGAASDGDGGGGKEFTGALLDGDLDEEKFVRALKRFGYDPSTMDPTESRGLPRLGTLAYDLHTGRRIVHKGNNRWVGVKDPRFVVQYEMPAQAVAYDAALAAEDAATAGAGSAVDPFGELSLVSLRPKIQYHRSGAVTVLNPSLLNSKSRFLREHRSVFLDNFTNHNLSEYSGLLSSTYFDLTVHARAAALHGGDSSIAESSAGDDDITDFNYIQSSSSPQNAKKGFTQSFLTDTAASLARSHMESRVYPAFDNPASPGRVQGGLSLNAASVVTVPGSTVRYTAAGNPIRGARKPHASGASLLTGVPERASEQNWRYSVLSSSYKGKQDSEFGTGGTAQGSRKTVLSSTAPSEPTNISSAQSSDKWKASNWGRLKRGVEKLASIAATDPEIKSNIYRAVTNESVTSSVGYDAETLDFAAAQREKETAAGANNSDADSDEEMWRSRSVYKVGKDAAVKVGVWPRKPQKNYKLRYTWVPQPLVHNAVNNLYYEKTVWDFRRDAAGTNSYDYKKELRERKPRHQAQLEKSAMLSLVGEEGASRSTGRAAARHTVLASRGSMLSGGDLSPLGDKSGVHSPSASSVASSKYYKHFIEGAGGEEGAYGQHVGAGGAYRGDGSRVGLGSGVMITALQDGDSSVGSQSDGEFGAPDSAATSPARKGKDSSFSEAQRKLLRQGSNVSYTLRGGEEGRSAHYDVHSTTTSNVGSPSPTSSAKYPGGAKQGAFSPAKGVGISPPGAAGGDSIYQFPSPLTSYNDLQGLVVGGDVDNRSGWSSPGASVSAAGGPSGPGSTAGSAAEGSGAWDATSGAPLGAFYSAKSTSKSVGKLGAHVEDPDAEFAQAVEGGAAAAVGATSSYLAERPAALGKEVRRGVMFVEKDSTADPAAMLKANHYLHQRQRDVSLIREEHAATAGDSNKSNSSSKHLVVQPAPPAASPASTGAYAPKFKFKPPAVARTSSFNEAEALAKATLPRTAKPAPPAAPVPASTTAGTGAGAREAAGSQRLPTVDATSAKSGRVSSPPRYTGSGEAANFSSSKEAPLVKEGSSKRLGKGDTIHPYSWA